MITKRRVRYSKSRPGEPGPYNENCPDGSMSEDLKDSGLTDKGRGSAAEYYFEFRGVNKAFDEHVVLQNVSFKVKRGDTCVIMGRSGVGKSVSLKHLLGFLMADSRNILIARVDVPHFTERPFEGPP